MTEKSKHDRGTSATHSGPQNSRTAGEDTPVADAANQTPDEVPSSAESPRGGPGDPGDSPPTGTAAPAAGASESAAELRDRWLRTEADLQNYRRRSQRDLEEAVRFAEERVLLEMISVLDDLERALAARAGEPDDAWLQGVELVANRMRDVVAREGVARIDPLGQPFDPALHEALLEIEPAAGAIPGTVAQVVRAGYQRDGRALRPARVVVVKERHSGDAG